jgi:hypothetical protein
MPTPPPHATRGRALLALGALLAAGIVLALSLRGRARPPRPSLRPTIVPLSLAPHGTRAILALDLTRVRASPALATLVDRLAGEPGRCERPLLARVQRVLAFASGLDLRDLSLVFEGDLPREELLACARALNPTRDPLRAAVTYRGVTLRLAGSARDGALLPPADPSAVAWLDGGLVLAGPASSVRAMIDRAHAPPGESSLSPALSVLSDRVESGAVVGLVALTGERAPGWTSVLARVEGFSLGVYDGPSPRLVARLACEDFDSPRAVADGLLAARDDLADRLALPAVAGLLRGARVERGASEVTVTLSVRADEAAMLALAARAVLSAPASDAQDPGADADRDANGDAGADAQGAQGPMPVPSSRR